MDMLIEAVVMSFSMGGIVGGIVALHLHAAISEKASLTDSETTGFQPRMLQAVRRDVASENSKVRKPRQ